MTHRNQAHVRNIRFNPSALIYNSMIPFSADHNPTAGMQTESCGTFRLKPAEVHRHPCDAAGPPAGGSPAHIFSQNKLC